MNDIHIGPADLMSARNGETVIVRVADWDSGIKVAFDIQGGEMASLDDGIDRVVLSAADFGLIADAKGAGHQVTADNGAVYGVSVWV